MQNKRRQAQRIYVRCENAVLQAPKNHTNICIFCSYAMDVYVYIHTFCVSHDSVTLSLCYVPCRLPFIIYNMISYQ